MDKQWQSWVMENLQRNCDPAGIRDILLQNKFSLDAIRAVMGEKFPEEATAAPASAAYIPAPSHQHHAKTVSLLEIQRDLARLNPRAGMIERRTNLSGNEFLEKYYSANKPVILCGLMSLWQAPGKWTPEYLKAMCGTEMVEIMAGRNTNPEYEIDDAPHRKNVTFANYVDMVSSDKETNDYYMTARNNFFSRPGARPLLKDIELFTEYLKESRGDGIYLWYGPKGTLTPLHHDSMNIFMAQVQGRKKIKMIPANEIELVYNHFAVYSQVDIEAPDYAKFPKFRHANIIELELAPGEVLFIPVGWWHSVKSLDRSITISFNNFLFPNEFKWENPKGGKAASGY